MGILKLCIRFSPQNLAIDVGKIAKGVWLKGPSESF